jgi:hypothetical protein
MLAGASVAVEQGSSSPAAWSINEAVTHGRQAVMKCARSCEHVMLPAGTLFASSYADIGRSIMCWFIKTRVASAAYSDMLWLVIDSGSQLLTVEVAVAAAEQQDKDLIWVCGELFPRHLNALDCLDNSMWFCTQARWIVR